MWLIDKLVIGVGYALAIFDREALDGLVNGIAALFAELGPAAAHGADGPRPELRPGAVRRHGGHRPGAGRSCRWCDRDPRSRTSAASSCSSCCGCRWSARSSSCCWRQRRTGALAPPTSARWRRTSHGDRRRPHAARAWRIATFFAAVTFLLAAWLLIGFDRASAEPVPVRDAHPVAAVRQRLPHRRRRPEHAAGRAERAADAERDRRLVAHRHAPAAVLQPVPDPRVGRRGRVHRRSTCSCSSCSGSSS